MIQWCRYAIVSLALLLAACAGERGTSSVPVPGQPSAGDGAALYLIFFAFDSVDISPLGQSIVRKVVEDAQANPPIRVTVNGYADRVGPAGYNQALSEDRAEVVVQALVRNGLRNVNIRKLGMGEEQDAEVPVGGRHVSVKLHRQ
ncbi:MAG: OmpA family protein [Alphaproteobacteria bacterium]|nr:OmpA family protein [Alphaproteobacteria bacterium]